MSNYNSFAIRKALSSETRDKIVSHLIENGPTSVGDIAAAIGSTHSGVSHELNTLRMFGIVSCDKKGPFMMYQVAKSEAGKTARKIMRV
jgi:DNA-binding transcriptional ArsR family regulator